MVAQDERMGDCPDEHLRTAGQLVTRLSRDS